MPINTQNMICKENIIEKDLKNIQKNKQNKRLF